MKPELVNLIGDFWSTAIAEAYKAGKITTERSLQASIYMELRQRLPLLNIFVEPAINNFASYNSGSAPDLIVCDENKILLVAELKFVPHNYPHYQHDIEKLKAFFDSRSCAEYRLSIDPKTGQFADNTHLATDQTTYAFFVVGRSDSAAVYRQEIKSLLRTPNFSRQFALFYGRVFREMKIEFGVELGE